MNKVTTSTAVALGPAVASKRLCDAIRNESWRPTLPERFSTVFSFRSVRTGASLRDRVSGLFRAERVAARDLSRFQAGHEPSRALFRRAVSESVRHDISLRLA